MFCLWEAVPYASLFILSFFVKVSIFLSIISDKKYIFLKKIKWYYCWYARNIIKIFYFLPKNEKNAKQTAREKLIAYEQHLFENDLERTKFADTFDK